MNHVEATTENAVVLATLGFQLLRFCTAKLWYNYHTHTSVRTHAEQSQTYHMLLKWKGINARRVLIFKHVLHHSIYVDWARKDLCFFHNACFVFRRFCFSFYGTFSVSQIDDVLLGIHYQSSSLDVRLENFFWLNILQLVDRRPTTKCCIYLFSENWFWKLILNNVHTIRLIVDVDHVNIRFE